MKKRLDHLVMTHANFKALQTKAHSIRVLVKVLPPKSGKKFGVRKKSIK